MLLARHLERNFFLVIIETVAGMSAFSAPAGAPPVQKYYVTVPQGVEVGKPFAVIINGQKQVFLCPPGAGPGTQVIVNDASKADKESGGWNCVVCSFFNSPSALACSMCSHHRPGRVGDWTCSMCQSYNPPTASNCLTCDKVRFPEHAPHPPPYEKSSADQDWQCSACTLLNSRSQLACMACGSPSPAVVSSAKSSSDGPPRHTASGRDSSEKLMPVLSSARMTKENALECATEMFIAGISRSDISKKLKNTGISGGKAALLLLKAMRAAKKSSGGTLPVTKPSALRQASQSRRCPICQSRLQMGKVSEGKAGATASCLCDHYFCLQCLGEYVKSKIDDGQVAEKDLICPEADCTKSMLLGPMGDFNPNYLQSFLKAKYPTEWIDSWERFLNHRNRRSQLYFVCPNKRCEMKLAPRTADQDIIKCPEERGGCGKYWCINCKRPAHRDKSCEAAAQEAKADMWASSEQKVYVAQGGRWCPKDECAEFFEAEDPDPENWSCDHITCICGHQYCRNCGANMEQIFAHDNSYHHPKCGLYRPASESAEDYGKIKGKHPKCQACYELNMDPSAPTDLSKDERLKPRDQWRECGRRPQEIPATWRKFDPQFSGEGIEFFDGHPKLKIMWINVGKHPKGRKCKPGCGCNYGSNHSSWVSEGSTKK